jgi:hypothetical protein
MGNASKDIPTLYYGNKIYPESLIDSGMPLEGGNVWFVDGDKSTGGAGKTWDDAHSLIQDAIDASSAGDVIYIANRTHTDATGDPVSYEENLTIPFTKPNLSLIGISRGLTQGGLPQLKDGATTTQHILRVRAPGCLIANLGFNGAGNTGGGILLDDDYSTKAAWGTTIAGCHFKNCKGTTATDSRTGGAINWPSAGNAWQVSIVNNHFYRNVGDIVLPGTSNTRPQDVVIRGNTFNAYSTSATDCNIYGAGGSGFNGIVIDKNIFAGMPALGSGSVVRFMDLTGCTGIVSNNVFACYINATATELTFGANGTAAKCPATVWLCNNWGKSNTVGETAEVIQIA